jgi:hypothetical protein
VSISAETPGAGATPSGGVALGRHRTWRALLVVLGILVAMATWYVLTVDAIRNEVGLRALQEGTRVTLAGIDPERGIGFSAASLKNVSVLPITVLGMNPVRVPSDWRVREMRLGVLSSEGDDPLAGTKPFTPQRLARGETTDVVIVWAALPCDAPRLADGTVSGPVEFRIEYSILGMDRAHTFRQGGGRYEPLSVIGCPPF